MRQTKLVLFDGLPGSGKSVQAQWLETQLLRHAIAARWFWEGEVGHPLNWFVDWWLPDFDLAAYFQDLGASMSHSLECWRTFVQQAAQSETITLLDGWPFLNSMGMFRIGGADDNALKHYARQVRDLIRPLKPVVFYLFQPDSTQVLRRILDIRGENFRRALFYNMSRFPYCHQRGLIDFECVDHLWQTHQTMYHDLLPVFGPDAVWIDLSRQTWDECRGRIAQALDLKPDPCEPDGLEQLTGAYRGERSVDVRLEDGVLIACENERSSPLVWLHEHSFYLQGRPTVWMFHPANQLTIDATRETGAICTLRRMN